MQRLNPSEETKLVSIRFTASDLARIRTVSLNTKVSVASYVRKIIIKQLDAIDKRSAK
jgi:hypothetical protein